MVDDGPAGVVPGRKDAGRRRLEPIAALSVLLLPIVVALGAWVGNRWRITGDWAAMDLRIGQVGTAQTPLVGAYSTRGWAHPGPAIYWLAAPLHRLLGGDPRSMLITAAAVNAAAMVAAWWLVRRRLGDAASLWLVVVLALLVRGLLPARVIDLWNPLLPLLPLLLLCFLVWSIALGARRRATAAIVLAALIAQAHVGMAPIVLALVAWTALWVLVDRRVWRPELGEPSADGSPGWGRPIALGLGISIVLWIPPMIDQLTGTGNLGHVVRYFVGGSSRTIGLGRSAGLMSTYLGPHGPGVGRKEPIVHSTVAGFGVVVLGVVLLVLATLVVVCFVRRERTLAAGTSLALALVVSSTIIGARVDDPVFDYLVKWMAIVAAFAWFWIGWASWTLVRRRVGSVVPLVVHVVAWVLIIGVTASSVQSAAKVHSPGPLEVPAVESLARDLAKVLPRDEPVRFEQRGDDYGNTLSGLVYRLRKEGFDVVTSDGWQGQKYGPEAVWEVGDAPSDSVYTVAVDFPEQYVSPRQDCANHGAEPVASYDRLTSTERARMEALASKRLFHPDQLTAADVDEGHELSTRAFAVTVFQSPEICTTKR